MRVLVAIAVFISQVFLINTAQAERLNYSAEVTGVSNYIFRGRSLSDDSPALQAGFYIANDQGWTYRFWGSSYDVNGDTDGLAEFSLSYKGTVDQIFDVSFGTKYYGYESEDRESEEWHVGLGAFDVMLEYHRNEELDTEYFDLSYFWQWNESLRLDFHYGTAKPIYQNITSSDYSVTASYTWNKDFKFFVTTGSHEDYDSFALVGVTYTLL